MAKYWDGPAFRNADRPRWATTQPLVTGQESRQIPVRRAQPFVPRRWRAVARLSHIKLNDVNFLLRYVAHITVFSLVVFSAYFYDTDFAALLPKAPVEVEPVAAPVTPWPSLDQPMEEGAYLTWGPMWTVVPEVAVETVPEAEALQTTERPAAPRVDPITYEVRAGDNPNIIAQRFGLEPSTIVWSNTDLSKSGGMLSVGQKVIIPATDGILHTVEEGDSLTAIAATYSVDPNAVIAYAGNHITDPNAPLVLGQYVMVPGGLYPYEAPPAPPTPAPVAPARPAAANPPAASAPLAPANPGAGVAVGCCRWPASGRITSQPTNWHMALDIAAPTGRPIVAADGGRVIAAGWDNTGYGYRVIVSHGNGLTTLYGHMSRFPVSVGDYVAKGQVIGYIGSTGNSSGPHLHFEVRRNGYRQNPYSWLP